MTILVLTVVPFVINYRFQFIGCLHHGSISLIYCRGSDPIVLIPLFNAKWYNFAVGYFSNIAVQNGSVLYISQSFDALRPDIANFYIYFLFGKISAILFIFSGYHESVTSVNYFVPLLVWFSISS
jgi:hypothetical protein